MVVNVVMLSVIKQSVYILYILVNKSGEKYNTLVVFEIRK